MNLRVAFGQERRVVAFDGDDANVVREYPGLVGGDEGSSLHWGFLGRVT